MIEINKLYLPLLYLILSLCTLWFYKCIIGDKEGVVKNRWTGKCPLGLIIKTLKKKLRGDVKKGPLDKYFEDLSGERLIFDAATSRALSTQINIKNKTWKYLK